MFKETNILNCFALAILTILNIVWEYISAGKNDYDLSMMRDARSGITRQGKLLILNPGKYVNTYMEQTNTVRFAKIWNRYVRKTNVLAKDLLKLRNFKRFVKVN